MVTTVLDRPIIITTTDEPALPKTRGQEWADKILAEGRLGINRLVTPSGLRCAIGVIGDFYLDGDSQRSHQAHFNSISVLSLVYKAYWGIEIVQDNNDFEGTPEQRCRYIAERIKVLI